MTQPQPKVIRTATIPLSLRVLLKGQLQFLSAYFSVSAIAGQGSDIQQLEEQEGIQVQTVQFKRNISIVHDALALIQLCLIFWKKKPHIVHSITPKAGLLSMLAARICGVPVRIHTFTGLIFPYKTGLLQTLLIQMDKVLCASATVVIAEGKGVKADLEKFGITRKPIQILANGNVNGIDTQYFSREALEGQQNLINRETLGIPSDYIILVFVGRMVRDKGIIELIDAFKRLALVQPKTALILVGPFEQHLDPLPQETILELEQNKAIWHVGFQEDIRPFLYMADVFVFPSYREGFPNTVMQAGALNLPCIVTDISGCNEIIEHMKNGLIIPPKDANALFDALLQITENSALRQELASNSRQLIETRYQQKQVWEAVLELYQTELNKMTKGR